MLKSENRANLPIFKKKKKQNLIALQLSVGDTLSLFSLPAIHSTRVFLTKKCTDFGERLDQVYTGSLEMTSKMHVESRYKEGMGDDKKNPKMIRYSNTTNKIYAQMMCLGFGKSINKMLSP